MIAPPIHTSIPQLHALTGLRGLAAWMVVVYHARRNTAAWMPTWLTEVAGYGYLAVDLFFMLSGFVLWLNYGTRLRDGGLGEAPRFWWRRFARIWPLHITILCAMAAFALLLLATGRDASSYPVAELPLHALLVQNWGFTSELSWNHPAWSISTEAGAYLLFPFAVLAWRWERLRPRALVGLIVLCALLLHLIYGLAGERGLGGQIPRLGLLRCLAEFAIGMALGNLWLAWRGSAQASGSCALAGLAILVTGVTTGAAQTLFVPLALAALLLATALAGGTMASLLGSRPLRWLGDVSYATYLAHFPFFILVKLLLVGEDLQLGASGFLAYCAALLALSGALYHGLEKPAQRRLNLAQPGFTTRSKSEG